MKKPVKEISANYRLYWKFDLTRVRELFWLNFFSLVLLFAAMIAFGFFIYLHRSADISLPTHYRPPTVIEALTFLAQLFGTVAIMILLHEGLHGLFFWIFTGSRPKFAFKLYYAYASAPGWFIPRWQYFFISLAPLVGITFFAVLGILYLPVLFLLPLYLLVIFNTSGAVGDLWVTGKLISAPPDTMIRDFGDAIEFYRAAPEVSDN
jgi:hypothetical protein